MRVKTCTKKLTSFALAFALVLAGTGTFAGLNGAFSLNAKAAGEATTEAVVSGIIDPTDTSVNGVNGMAGKAFTLSLKDDAGASYTARFTAKTHNKNEGTYTVKLTNIYDYENNDILDQWLDANIMEGGVDLKTQKEMLLARVFGDPQSVKTDFYSLNDDYTMDGTFIAYGEYKADLSSYHSLNNGANSLITFYNSSGGTFTRSFQDVFNITSIDPGTKFYQTTDGNLPEEVTNTYPPYVIWNPYNKTLSYTQSDTNCVLQFNTADGTFSNIKDVNVDENGNPYAAVLPQYSDGGNSAVLKLEALRLIGQYSTSGYETSTGGTTFKDGLRDITMDFTRTENKENSGNSTITAYGLKARDVKIDETTFPDANFRAWVLEQSYGADGILTTEEVAYVTWINVGKSLDADEADKIADLTGIEYFTALRTLRCEYNQLTSLDVSNNTALTALYCNNNRLTELDVSHNTDLQTLWCFDNNLTSLDLSNNTDLTMLSCSSNQLTSLDVSHNTALTILYCFNNSLTSLDVSNNTALTTLNCSENQLTSFDVSHDTALTKLECYANQLTSLDVSNNTALGFLNCFNNALAELDLSHNIALTSLSCGSNNLTSLDLSNNTALTELNCRDNQLTALDLSNLENLVSFSCDGNVLSSIKLNFSKGTAGGKVLVLNGGRGTVNIAREDQAETLYGPLLLDFANNTVSLTNPTADGYTFTGWTITGDATQAEGTYGTDFTVGSGDSTITATWKQNFTVKYVDGLGNTLLEETVAEGSATPAYSGTPTREGYTFTGWTPTVAETVTADATYTATWEENAPSPLDYTITVALPCKMRWQGISGENITKTLGNVKIEYTSKQYGRFAGVALLVVDTSRLPDGKQIKVSIPNRNVTINVGGVDLTASVVAFEDTILDNSGSCQLRIDLVTDRSDLDYDTFFGKPITGSLAISVEELT